MSYVRHPAAADAFDLAALKLHARVDHDDDDDALELMGRTAVTEVETYCENALLTQTIEMIVEASGEPIPLPVGPLAPDAGVTVAGVPVLDAVTAGRYPILTIPDTITGLVLVTYQAGYGDAVADIPADLSYAVLDHASRLYDLRGASDGKQGLSIAAARICARHRRIRP